MIRIFFYSSDNGFHSGQFGLVMDKRLPYEFDIRVPFFARGPGIKPGTKSSNAAVSIDLAPTFFDIAGINDLSTDMDGRSLKNDWTNLISAPEDYFLIEYHGEENEYTSGPCVFPGSKGTACFNYFQYDWPPFYPKPEFLPFGNVQDSTNNTYSCLRIVGSSQRIYCEFVTGFVEYYHINTDPYQLTNLKPTPQERQSFGQLITRLGKCSGVNCRK